MSFKERDLPIKVSALSVDLRCAFERARIETLGVAACLSPRYLDKHRVNAERLKTELKQHYGLELACTAPSTRIAEVYGSPAEAPAAVAVAMGLLTRNDLDTFTSSMGPASKITLTLGDFHQYGREGTIGRVLGGRRAKEFLEFLETCSLSPKN